MSLGSFKDVLPGLLQKISVTPRHYALLSLVEKEVSALSPGARVVGFKNNKIYIEVESSVELHEFTFKGREILKAVRSVFPQQERSQPEPQLKFFLKGTARPDRREVLAASAPRSSPDRRFKTHRRNGAGALA